ncbi:hypothetical protein [Vibrio barjaei]|uniref:hypothetical protein n=1 Tax=Vibrio barjaei TaxID=1676683 RepID=UPI002284EB7D|nr:hypothetical protein [Vibrio barjaei]MCY9872985.1 hypothetical protein [Vibrio barjaei]
MANYVHQSVLLAEDKKEADLLKLMRSAQPGAYELTIKVGDTLVRYSGSEKVKVLQEYFRLCVLKHFEDKSDVDSSLDFHVVYSTEDNEVREYVFENGLFVQDVIFKPRGRSSVTYTIEADLVERYGAVLIDEHEFPAKDVYLLSLADKIHAQRFRIAGGSALLATLAIGGFFLMPEEKAPEIVVKEVIKHVDNYESYRTYQGRIQLNDVYESVIATWLMQRRLPTGWVSDEIIIEEDGSLKAPILQNGGSIGALEAVSRREENGQFVKIDGQLAAVEAKIEPTDSAKWNQQIADFDTSRKILVDRVMALEGIARSRAPEVRNGVWYQDIQVELEGTGPWVLSTFAKILEQQPVFVDRVHVKTGLEARGVKIKLDLEVVGYRESEMTAFNKGGQQ